MNAHNPPAPGWYPYNGVQTYWNGTAWQTQTTPAKRYEYTVAELRESMIGDKMSGSKLQTLLNQHASQGWQLKTITAVDVKGRVGPGGVSGLLITFERQIG